MGYAFSGQCYQDAATALIAWQESFPRVGDVNLLSHVSSSITADGRLTYTVLYRSWSGTSDNRYGTIQLASCPNSDVIAPFDPVAAGGLFTFFFASVIMLWFAAKNMGVVIEAVRRW